MYITPLSPDFTSRHIVIQSSANKGRQYLYNEVQALTKKHHTTVNFRTEKIEIPETSKEFLKALMEQGIVCHEKVGEKLKLLI